LELEFKGSKLGKTLQQKPAVFQACFKPWFSANRATHIRCFCRPRLATCILELECIMVAGLHTFAPASMLQTGLKAETWVRVRTFSSAFARCCTVQCEWHSSWHKIQATACFSTKREPLSAVCRSAEAPKTWAVSSSCYNILQTFLETNMKLQQKILLQKCIVVLSVFHRQSRC
jgi:hypothetical protein